MCRALSLIPSRRRGRGAVKSVGCIVSPLCSNLPSNFTLLRCLEDFHGVLLSVSSWRESSGSGLSCDSFG